MVNRRRRCLDPDPLAAQRVVDAWNARVAVGDPVRYYRVLPMGPWLDTTTRDTAFVDQAGVPACFVVGVRGYVSLYHCLAASEIDVANGAVQWVDGARGPTDEGTN